MDNQAGSEEKNRNMVSSANYCYVDQLQSFAPNNQEIYNLATGMEMINFPPKSLQHHHHQSTAETNSAMWKEFFSGKNPAGNNIAGGCGPSSSKAASEFFHQDHHHEYNKGDFMTETTSSLLAVAPDHDYVDDSSLRCVFPCEGNERPSQGLSLSLSSANPSTIGLQSFELRQPDMFFSKSMEIQQNQEQNMIVQDGYLGKGSNVNYPNGFFQIRNSKYLGPAQDLLNEFCNLGSKQTDPKLKTKTQKSTQWLDQENIGSSSSKKPPLYALEVLELQKRKTKLLSMLEEVDRRYRHYCDQMKAVVSSFEAVAGNGAASIYSEMASKAMSRHFRCLRDGIVGQIKDTKKAMGEKDTAAPGTTRGETPRLRLLDQTLRQQRAYQQMSMMESHPWRPQRGLPERSVSVLRAWLFEHFLHPYPSDVDKHILARQTGLSRSQVSNWFINARVRLWKPMVEEMYLEETKEQDNIPSTDENICRPNQNSLARVEDLKPTPAQLGRIESECLSSIIINPDKIDSMRHSHNNNKLHHHQEHQHHHHHHQQQQQQDSFGRVTEPFGAVELDFSSYNHHQGFEGRSGNGTGGGGGGVSLTLGLQQHGGNGVSLAFTPATQSSLFYPRDHIEDCQTVQFSLLDGEAQNLPYRNLMGAQLLHDLAG